MAGLSDPFDFLHEIPLALRDLPSCAHASTGATSREGTQKYSNYSGKIPFPPQGYFRASPIESDLDACILFKNREVGK